MAAARTEDSYRAGRRSSTTDRSATSSGSTGQVAYTVCEIGELFTVWRSIVYRAVRRADRPADSEAAAEMAARELALAS